MKKNKAKKVRKPQAQHAYRTEEIAETLAVPPWRVRDLCDRNFLKPSVWRGRVGPGGARLWSEGDLMAIALAFRMSRLGIVGNPLRKILRRLRRLDPHRQRPGTLIVATESDVEVVRGSTRLQRVLCQRRAAVVFDLVCLSADIETGKARRRS